MIRILLVEDHPLVSRMMSERLTLKGFAVTSVGDGEAAVTTAVQNPPDVILMDLSLPVMSGLEAAAQLKQRPETRHVPIIALTAHAVAGARELALENGCDDYEAKPPDFARLLEKIMQHAARTRRPEEG